MYVIQYVNNKNVNIDFEERFLLFDGLELLREFNKQAIDTNNKFFIQYKIIDDVNNKEILVDKIACGSSYRIDFFQLTKDRLSNLFSGEELQDILGLLEEIEVQYTSEKDEFYAQKNSEIRDEILEVKDHENLKKDNSTVENININDRFIQRKNIKDKKSLLNRVKEIFSKKKIISTLIIIIAGITIVSLSSLYMKDSTEIELAPYEELIREQKFSEALEIYPERFAETEQAIVSLGENGIPYLDEFIKLYPTYEEAQFDLDFLKKEFESLIEKRDIANTDKRRTQLIIAYIHLDQLEKANEINHLVHDRDLNREIDEVYFNLVLENIKRKDLEKVNEYMHFANSTEINEFVSSLNDLNAEINVFDSLEPDKKESFFNSRKYDKLTEEKKELLNTNPFNIVEDNSSNTRLLIGIPIIICTLIVFGFFSLNKLRTKKTENDEEKAFDVYLDNKLYLAALKEFPHKYPQIERTIFLQGESEIPYLEEFISKKKNYKQAHFDLAFLKKEFKKVIDLEKYADTDGRKAQLAIAFIQQGELDKANDINQIIQVPELSYYLNEHYYQLTVAALKNDDYSLAYEYQALGNSPDIDFLIDTIHLIDKKIEEVNINKVRQEDPSVLYKLQRLNESKAMSLNLD